ncbi:uncharacterized protein K460DRAFT_435139 [Cucurbitaria berberidis CBS 394.84]|uniref:Selenoprotein W family protein n=1 Tax=Cucurbitaria berberidis CBS 394.84 TaxID=1168544 RepID=A0A9P4G9X8_9PLEO|nr:uncharacterized protein K460DRAFT_435139 [Cucurbitaria berberidis CBS 394.84]KAF1841873.1 hypothetical protein K460DRAFT_435139 [Cucurbitaria berberidis CBS 394.84]
MTDGRFKCTSYLFGQELLSTFGTQIGEIALIPATGGLFTVELTYLPSSSSTEEGRDVDAKKVLLWDRKAEGGFPETKVLKQRVRDHIDPTRDLGHSDKHGKKKEGGEEEAGKEKDSAKHGEDGEQKVQGKGTEVKKNPDGTVCEDCK